MGDITLAQAQALVDAAQQKAAEIDTLMNIAVVDAGGNLKALRAWTAPGWAASTFP